MSATTKWAIGAGFAIVAVAFGGAAAWRHQHPDRALIADLASVLPAIPRLESKPGTEVASTKPADATKVSPVAPPSELQQSDLPHFDVARVEPTGDAVVAGRGAPNAKVALMEGTKVLADTRSDANGQFVLLPPPLPSGELSLTLRQSPNGQPAVESSQTLVLTVPEGGKGQVVIALAEPGKPTRMLSAPPTPGVAWPPTLAARFPAPAPPSTGSTTAPTRLAIRSTKVGNGNGFEASGVAAPGTPVHLYINNSHLADVVAGGDGEWHVVIRRDLAGGHYAVRAEAMSPGNQVADRLEVPFDVPYATAAATSVSPADSRKIPQNEADVVVENAAPASDGPAAPADRTPAPGTTSTPAQAASHDPARVVIEAIETRKVSGGDNLWNISRQQLGNGMRFPQIYAANANQIRDPNLIYPGQIFVLPRK